MKAYFGLMLKSLESLGWKIDKEGLIAAISEDCVGVSYQCSCTLTPNRRNLIMTIFFSIPVHKEEDVRFITSLKRELYRRAYALEWDGRTLFSISRSYRYPELFNGRLIPKEFAESVNQYFDEIKDLAIQCKLSLDQRSLPMKRGLPQKAPEPHLRVKLCLYGWEKVSYRSGKYH